MNAIQGILAAYQETENAARAESDRYYALASKRFEEKNYPLSRLCYRRALRMEQFAAEMRATQSLLRATFHQW